MTMATCVTCGDNLNPLRAERYDYCTRPECRERNAKPLEILAVGVNKAADQYVVLTERAKQELESGRYKKVPGVPGTRRMARTRPTRAPGPAPLPASHATTSSAPPRWSKAQEDLALIYRSRGMKPDEIAAELGLSRYLVTQMLLAATNRGKP
jgi:hypothetical protein